MGYDPEILQQWDREHVWHPFTQMQGFREEAPLIISRGEGIYLYDLKGNRYLDGVSSLWANLHGHRRRELDEALVAQLAQVAHSTLLGIAHPPAILLARRLAEITPAGLNKVFFSDNGSTAVEVALKVAFQFWRNRGRGLKQRFLKLSGAYHGDTLGAVSVGGIPLFHEIYQPLLFDTLEAPAPYCYRCDLREDCREQCLARLEELVAAHHQELAAVIVEPVMQGAAGMIAQPPGYLARVREVTRRHDVLLIADEVAVGFGRTGRMFACEHEGVSPDLLCLAKGITGGYLPLAATLATDEVYEAFLGEYQEFKTFFHGHTYSGNPLGAAVGLASLDIFVTRPGAGGAAGQDRAAGRAPGNHGRAAPRGRYPPAGPDGGPGAGGRQGQPGTLPDGAARGSPGDPGGPGVGGHPAPPGGCHRADAALVHHRGGAGRTLRHY